MNSIFNDNSYHGDFQNNQRKQPPELSLDHLSSNQLNDPILGLPEPFVGNPVDRLLGGTDSLINQVNSQPLEITQGNPVDPILADTNNMIEQTNSEFLQSTQHDSVDPIPAETNSLLDQANSELTKLAESPEPEIQQCNTVHEAQMNQTSASIEADGQTNHDLHKRRKG